MVKKATPKKKPAKKKAKLAKKKTVKAIDAPIPSGEKTISVRAIDNGWLINESWVTPGGRYKNKETFTKEKPVFNIK